MNNKNNFKKLREFPGYLKMLKKNSQICGIGKPSSNICTHKTETAAIIQVLSLIRHSTLIFLHIFNIQTVIQSIFKSMFIQELKLCNSVNHEPHPIQHNFIVHAQYTTWKLSTIPNDLFWTPPKQKPEKALMWHYQ